MALSLQLAAFALLIFGDHVLGNYLHQVKMTGSAEYGYHGDKGPEFWCKLDKKYEKCCNSKRQSPVNINVKITKYPADHITYKNIDKAPEKMTLLNNKHSVLLETGDVGKPTISLEFRGIKKDFKLNDVHFHWGKISSRGSEHSLDKRISPMEMHIVFIDKKYKDILEAVNGVDAIAVIGVFFEISKHDNHRLNSLINYLNLVKYPEIDENGNLKNKDIPSSFPLSNLFPSSHDYFFSYDGSLTSPPCSENVRWNVLDTKVPISEAQMNKFRELQEEPQANNQNNAFPMVDNYRPQQKLNNREIFKSKHK